MRVLLLDSRGWGRVPDGTFPAISLRRLWVQSGQPLPQDRSTVGGWTEAAQCSQSRAHPCLGEFDAAIGGDGQVPSLLLQSFNPTFLEMKRHTKPHWNQWTLFLTMQICIFIWPTVMGKGWDFSSLIYGHFISIIRESMLKRKEHTRLLSNLPSRQELFFWATLESSITGSWCWIIDDDDGRFAYR